MGENLMLEERQFRTPEPDRNQCGAVIVMVALLLVVFVGFAAMAIDIGHLLVVRNELQNAADAAALAGASHLYPQIPPASPSPPDWAAGETAASTNAPVNKAGGVVITDYEVQLGYWNFAHTPPGLQSTGITPGAQDFAAIKVTVRRANGKNGGPLGLFFAPVLGIKTSDVSATATAVMASPGTAKPGALLPVAISKAVADQKSSYTCPDHTFKIGSSYHYPASMAGQWTSFETDRNDVPTVRDLIANGNPTPLSIGDNIWIQPGSKTTLYNSIPVPADVMLPVVDAVLSDSTHSAVPIWGFVCFHITGSEGGSKKYIEGCFNDSCYAGLTTGVGPNYGAYAPPTLVQ
ncbi:MAG: pilus assembly protein TadE [Acidobacteria bacterium]|nr:pilus assembly protein TadE [Acidobacteriota bacterium]